MTIAIEHYQESGPASGGRGTTTTLITNVGWRAVGFAEDVSNYAAQPISRPLASTGAAFTVSYDYYTFFKISGVYFKASRPRFKISGNPNGDAPQILDEEGNPIGNYDGAKGGARLFFRLTDTYSTPVGLDQGDLVYYDGTPITLYPKMSLTGPTTDLQYYKFLDADTTYYSQMLHTRIYVEAGSTYGNLGELTITCLVDEYEGIDL